MLNLRELIGIALTLIVVGAVVWQQKSLRAVIHDFEYNPQVQYRVHRYATWYWLVNFPIVAILFFGFPTLWIGIGLLLNTFYSLYSNFATDYGAMSAALAAQQVTPSEPQALTTCRHCRARL